MAIEERASVCPFDCPDTCSLSVSVDEGRIVKVRGSHAAPYTAGVICNKVARDMGAFVHGPGRLRHPLRRIGAKGSGRFERISWDAALDEIHERVTGVIARWGPQAVMPLNYAGPHGLLAGDSMSARFFNRLGATQLYRRALCGGVRSEAWAGTYGAVPGCPPELAEAAALNVVWGNNATVSNLHLVRSHPTGKPGRRQARGRRPAAHEDCRAGGSPSAAAARHRRSARLGRCRRARANGRARRSLHRRACAGLRGVHGPGPRMACRAGSRRLRAGGRPDPQVRALAGRGDNAGVGARQWARTRPQRRQRHPGGDCAPGAARKARPRRRHRLGREQCLPKNARQAAAARSDPRRHAHPQHQRHRSPSCR